MVPWALARFLSIRVPSGDLFGVLKALVGEGRRAKLQKRDRVAMDGRDESEFFCFMEHHLREERREEL